MAQRTKVFLTDDLDGTNIPAGRARQSLSPWMARRTRSTSVPRTATHCGRSSRRTSKLRAPSEPTAERRSSARRLEQTLKRSKSGRAPTPTRSATAAASQTTSAQRSRQRTSVRRQAGQLVSWSHGVRLAGQDFLVRRAGVQHARRQSNDEEGRPVYADRASEHR
jgi:hypothetical protein